MLYITVNSRRLIRFSVWAAAVCAAAVLLCLWALDAKERSSAGQSAVSAAETEESPPVFAVVTPTEPEPQPEHSSSGESAKEPAVPAHVNLSSFTIDRTVALPLESAVITSGFGFRDHPINGEYRFHSGLDLAAPEGTAIYAMLEGTVITAKFASDYGNYVILDHGSFQTLYAHCLTLLVKEGDEVAKGQQIAEVGATGSATGNHLHVEFRRDGQRYDPAQILGQSYS